MKAPHVCRTIFVTTLVALTFARTGRAEPTPFHHAPPEATQVINPYANQPQAIQTGSELYLQYCAACHGRNAEGSGNIPALAHGAVQTVAAGEVFWFITKGSVSGAMPSWASLPEQQRWEIVSYLQTLRTAPAAAPTAATGPLLEAPPPRAPFTDFRYEKPGAARKISVSDLPPPFATASASNAPSLVARPPNVLPQAPAGFKVNLYADSLAMPRVIRIAPNGDVFVAESGAARIRMFHGVTADGKPQSSGIFASHLNRPYGIAFYPVGPNPRWVYVGDTDAVVRFRYRSGDLEAQGGAEHIVDLPHGGGHWTRDVRFSRDGKTLFVAVGSASNVDDPDTTHDELNRADILAFDPDGTHMRVFASGIRNPSGLAIDPATGELWCTVNERDGLGDNLVPDYITHVADGGFYGWPWWYIGSHQDPRHAGKHPELQSKTIVPDVLLQPHNASLQMTFYEGRGFPTEYVGDIFAAEHGSWNKNVRAGYEVIRIPRHHTGQPSGDYQDFLTGFVLPSGEAWGRPVGIVGAADGALLVTDDGSNSIWRVQYVGADKTGQIAQSVPRQPEQLARR